MRHRKLHPANNEYSVQVEATPAYFGGRKVDRAAQEAHTLAAILQQVKPHTRKKLEVHLQVRSSQVVTQRLRQHLLCLQSKITQLREHDLLTDTITSLSPLSNLRTFAFCLPRKPNDQRPYQDAVRLLPSLQDLQIFFRSRTKVNHLPTFLQVLMVLPRVTTLRVVTNEIALCLPSEFLQSIVTLELGKQVWVDHLASSLRHLELERLELGYPGYEQMLSGLQHMVESMTLHSFEVVTLAALPSSLQKLYLKQSIADYLGSLDDLFLRLALVRLGNLQVLCLADFLDAPIVGLLSAMANSVVFSRLHTFGIAVDANKRDLSHVVNVYTGALEICTPPDLPNLAELFPEVRQVFVSVLGTVKHIILDCRWVSHLVFPKVRGLVVHCPHHNVALRNLPNYVYATFK